MSRYLVIGNLRGWNRSLCRLSVSPRLQRRHSGILSTRAYRSAPRTLPSHGCTVIDQENIVEEEGLPEYNHQHYYPVKLGEILHDRYQVLAKLGYGSCSTIWLARDLQ